MNLVLLAVDTVFAMITFIVCVIKACDSQFKGSFFSLLILVYFGLQITDRAMREAKGGEE